VYTGSLLVCLLSVGYGIDVNRKKKEAKKMKCKLWYQRKQYDHSVCFPDPNQHYLTTCTNN